MKAIKYVFIVLAIILSTIVIFLLIRRLIRNKKCARGEHYDKGKCNCVNCGKKLREHKYIKYVKYGSYPPIFATHCAICNAPINKSDESIGCSKGHIGLMRNCQCMACSKYEHGPIINCRCTNCGKEMHQWVCDDTSFYDGGNFGVTRIEMYCKVCGMEKHDSYKF